MTIPSNVALPGLGWTKRSTALLKLPPSGMGVVPLTRLNQPSASCRALLLQPEVQPLDVSNLVVLSTVGEDVTFDLVFADRERVLAPGVYTVEYEIGRTLQGSRTFAVVDSALNRRSSYYDELTATREQLLLAVLDVVTNGAATLTVQIPSAYDAMLGGMGFCVLRNGAPDNDSSVVAHRGSGLTVTLTVSNPRAGQVVRCIFY